MTAIVSYRPPAVGVPAAVPTFSVGGGTGFSCVSTGRFVVNEVELAPGGLVTRFWATFEEHSARIARLH